MQSTALLLCYTPQIPSAGVYHMVPTHAEQQHACIAWLRAVLAADANTEVKNTALRQEEIAETLRAFMDLCEFDDVRGRAFGPQGKIVTGRGFRVLSRRLTGAWMKYLLEKSDPTAMRAAEIFILQGFTSQGKDALSRGQLMDYVNYKTPLFSCNVQAVLDRLSQQERLYSRRGPMGKTIYTLPARHQ